MAKKGGALLVAQYRLSLLTAQQCSVQLTAHPKHYPHDNLQNVYLESGQPCRVWDQEAGKVPANMGSSESSPLACLTSKDGQALNQEHTLGGPGAWGGGPENLPILAGKWRET
eukprot:487984-Pelagomonas_calceolata.AAC.3